MGKNQIILILIGPPGGGKTTYAEEIIKKYGFFLISAGQLLRQFAQGKSKLAQKVAKALETGRLAPNWVTDKLVEKELKLAKKRFLLDGYPRSITQARRLMSISKKLKLSPIIVLLNVSQKEIIKRLSARVFCPEGGEPFVLPKKICPRHKVKLITRPDDKPQAIKTRLAIFHQSTKPLLNFFQKKAKVIRVKIIGSNIRLNTNRIIKALYKHKIIEKIG
jgi:adenylate kinase